MNAKREKSAWRKLGGTNAAKPPVHVKHSELKRLDDNSAFKSVCPICKHGILFVNRNQEHIEYISAVDRCSVCMQVVIYNIVDLRNSTGYAMVWEGMFGFPDESTLPLTAHAAKELRKKIEESGI